LKAIIKEMKLERRRRRRKGKGGSSNEFYGFFIKPKYDGGAVEATLLFLAFLLLSLSSTLFLLCFSC